jgi:hypothetical protein
MNTSTKFGVLSVILLAPITLLTSAAESLPQPPPPATNSVAVPELSSAKPAVWQEGIGSGFLASAQNLTLEAGVAAGMATFGSRQAHDLGLLSRSYGHMLGGINDVAFMFGVTWFFGK